MDKPVVDIVIPTHDRPVLLSRALRSVVSQTYPHWQCTVVALDCGPATFGVLEGVNDPRVRVVPAGRLLPAEARNLGAALGAGEFLAFCDDDNEWASRFLEVMVSQVSAPFVMGYCAQQCYLAGGSPENLRVLDRKVRSVPFNPVRLLHENFIDTSCALVFRDTFDAVGGFDPTVPALEDWDLFARIAIKSPFRVVHVDEVLASYWHYLPEVQETESNRGLSASEVASDFDGGLQHPHAPAMRQRLRSLAFQSY